MAELDRAKKIVKARITDMPKSMFDRMPEVLVVLEGDETEKEHVLFSYFPDEISFRAEEFPGLTVEQALDLRHKRDVQYLRS